MAIHLTSLRLINRKLITKHGSINSFKNIFIKKRNFITFNKNNYDSVINFRQSLNLKQCKYYSTVSKNEYIVESPFGDVDIPNLTLPQAIWKDLEDWSDKPVVVSIYIFQY